MLSDEVALELTSQDDLFFEAVTAEVEADIVMEDIMMI